MAFFGVTFRRDIQRVQVAHALHSVALSFVSVYVPIFLLLHGRGLPEVIFFYVVYHLAGLAVGLFLVVPAMRWYGPSVALRASFPLTILFFALLNLMPARGIPWVVVALVGGAANFFYWMPLNMLLIRNADHKTMGSDLGGFFALPKIFSIAGPVVSAVLIPILGFWPMFLVSAFGLVVSFLPLVGIGNDPLTADIRPKTVWAELRRRKSLFLLEAVDNIVEESEWFWGIFVFMLIGSLSAPGLVGGLEAVGGALFALAVGKYANRHMGRVLTVSSVALAAIWGVRFLIDTPLSAYVATLSASFVMTAFLVSYMGTIYRKVGRDREETFVIVREIPTVLGRLVVFGGILLVASEPRSYFVVPIVAVLLILVIFATRSRTLRSTAEPAV